MWGKSKQKWSYHVVDSFVLNFVDFETFDGQTNNAHSKEYGKGHQDPFAETFREFGWIGAAFAAAFPAFIALASTAIQHAT